MKKLRKERHIGKDYVHKQPRNLDKIIIANRPA